MAKQHNSNGERSKVRIFFIEGDFAPGELAHLTQVLTNATRPASAFARTALPARSGTPAALPADMTTDDDAPIETQPEAGGEDGDGNTATEITRGPKGPARVRTYRKPQPVDMDMSAGDKPFKEFAAEKGPTSHRGKYLVAAAWLHDFAKIDPITSDHIFTCYKAAGWNFDIADPTFTFRQLKGEGLGSLKKGSFSLNHLGTAQVNDMKATA